MRRDTIQAAFDEYYALPFPKSIFAYYNENRANDIVDLVLTIPYAHGCIFSYLKNGSLDAGRIRILEGCVADLRTVPDVGDDAGNDYLRRLRSLGEVTLAALRGDEEVASSA